MPWTTAGMEPKTCGDPAVWPRTRFLSRVALLTMSFFVFLLWVHTLHDMESISLPAALCGVSPNFDAEARASGLGYGRHPKSDLAARCFEDLQGLSSKTAFCASVE